MRRAGQLIGLWLACASSVVVAQEPNWTWTELPSLPDTVGLAGAYVGVSNNALLVAGGANFPTGRPWDGTPKVWHDAIYVLTDPLGPWRIARTRLPRPIGYGVAVTLPDGVLCIGGGDRDRHYADCFLMTWTGDDVRITPTAALPLPLANSCGAALNTLVFVAGGIDAPQATECRGDFLTLNALPGMPTEWRWQARPTWPGPKRMLAVAGAIGSDLYLFGGIRLEAGADGKPVRSSPFCADAYRYSLGYRDADGMWARIADLPWPRAAGPSPAVELGASQLALLGGDNGALGVEQRDQHPGFPPEIAVFNVRGNRWTIAGALPRTIVGNPHIAPELSTWAPVTTGTARWQGRIVIPTGEARPGVRTPRVLSATVAP